MSRVLGGKDVGEPLVVPGVPTSALAAAITSWIAAKTKVTGRYVKLTTALANNYEFDVAAYDDDIHGRIEDYDPDGSTYLLAVHLFGFPSDRTGYVVRGIPGLVNLDYTGTMVLGDTVMSAGTPGLYVTSGSTSAGYGFVIAKDVPGARSASSVDVLFG